MKVYVCTDHNVHNPVGAGSIVIAEDERQAYSLLSEELKRNGLDGDDFTLKEIDILAPQAVILCDGEY